MFVCFIFGGFEFLLGLVLIDGYDLYGFECCVLWCEIVYVGNDVEMFFGIILQNFMLFGFYVILQIVRMVVDLIGLEKDIYILLMGYDI